MNRLRSLAQAVGELWRFAREGRRIAFFVVALVLLVFGALILLTEQTVVMPFIYTLF